MSAARAVPYANAMMCLHPPAARVHASGRQLGRGLSLRRSQHLRRVMGRYTVWRPDIYLDTVLRTPMPSGWCSPPGPR